VLKRNKVLSLCLPLLRAQSRRHALALNMLDVGCGAGALLHGVLERLPAGLRTRARPFGVEISTALAATAQAQLSLLGGSCVNDSALDGLGRFDADFFDLVVMSSYLEHEIQPLPVLRACLQRMRPGGSVVVKVPNYDSLNRRMRGARWCGFRWPDHVNYFTPATLRAMAVKAGFQIARMGLLDRQPFSDNMYAVLRKP
jgi:SAM-dependent methyltransferase